MASSPRRIGTTIEPCKPVARAPGPDVATRIRLYIARVDRLPALDGETGHALADGNILDGIENHLRNPGARGPQMQHAVVTEKVDRPAVAGEFGEDSCERVVPLDPGADRTIDLCEEVAVRLHQSVPDAEVTSRRPPSSR